MTRLLMPGDTEVAVFADASASDHLGIGSWAYSIPAFDVCGAGIDSGGHIERYELAGAVSGIEAAASIDGSNRPIHVHTDSDFVLAVLKHLAENAELPARRSYDRVRDLIQRASTAMGRRILSFTRCNGDSADHQRCHLAALSEIRWHIQNDVRLRRDLAIKREQQKLSGLLKRRIQLEKQLQALDLELAITDTNLRAIREFWLRETLSSV
jgi:ribonuclease HI